MGTYNFVWPYSVENTDIILYMLQPLQNYQPIDLSLNKQTRENQLVFRLL